MTENSIENGRDGADQVDEKRRAAIFTMAKLMTYSAPVVTTFAMGGMSIREAHAYGTNLAPCWVARAAFGESDFRWVVFRAWLFEDAPAWFRNLYLRHGERVGGWLRGSDNARRIVRALMMPAVRRKLKDF